MTPTMFELNVAIVMLAVCVVLYLWFEKNLSTASARRMMDMMKWVGVDARIASGRDPQTKAVMKEVRRRCAKCRSEGHCDRWLAGEVRGDIDFCPNASVFADLKQTV